jgi:hypothetical protein
MITLTFWLSFWAGLLGSSPVLFMPPPHPRPPADIVNLADWKRAHPPTKRRAA